MYAKTNSLSRQHGAARPWFLRAVTLGALAVLVAGTSMPRTADAFGERGSGAKIQPKNGSADKGKLRHRIWDKAKLAIGITLASGGTTLGIKAMEPAL